MLGCSPLKTFWSDRTLLLGKRKIKDLLTKFKYAMFIALSEPQLVENGDCSSCQRLVNSLKEKIKNCSSERKTQMFTLVSEDWTSKKTQFNISEHAVRQARKLKKEKRILATLESYHREGLGKETKKAVVKLYVRDVSHCI